MITRRSMHLGDGKVLGEQQLKERAHAGQMQQKHPRAEVQVGVKRLQSSWSSPPPHTHTQTHTVVRATQKRLRAKEKSSGLLAKYLSVTQTLKSDLSLT